MANAQSASLNGCLGAKSPAGSLGRAPGEGKGATESLLSIFIQKVAKI